MGMFQEQREHMAFQIVFCNYSGTEAQRHREKYKRMKFTASLLKGDVARF